MKGDVLLETKGIFDWNGTFESRQRGYLIERGTLYSKQKRIFDSRHWRKGDIRLETKRYMTLDTGIEALFDWRHWSKRGIFDFRQRGIFDLRQRGYLT